MNKKNAVDIEACGSTRLDEENAELAKRQAAFQRSQHDQEKGADDEFEQFCNEAMFRISVRTLELV